MEACLRCGRASSDLIHDNPNDHGWTGTSAMHPFVDERGKTLLQWTAREVSLHGKVGQKHHSPDPKYADWNRVIDVAKAAVERMYSPLTAEELASHDRYFKSDYIARAVSPHILKKPLPTDPNDEGIDVVPFDDETDRCRSCGSTNISTRNPVQDNPNVSSAASGLVECSNDWHAVAPVSAPSEKEK